MVRQQRCCEVAQGNWLDSAVEGLDQEVARYFLVTARCGCFMQAARSLSIKPNKLREQLVRLADSCGRTLFVYENSTLLLSVEGRELCHHLARQQWPEAVEQPLVRLAVAEPLLRDVIGRSLLGYLRQCANVRLELSLLEGPAPEWGQEVDILLWLAEPDLELPDSGFVAGEPEYMARFEYLPHVGKRYSREHRVPQDLSELQDYMLVSHRGYAGVAALGPWNRLIGARESGVTHVNSYDLQRQMIQWSACIGLLPHYVQQIDKNLRPLPGLFDSAMALHAWLAVREGQGRREEVRLLLELVRGAFRERRGRG